MRRLHLDLSLTSIIIFIAVGVLLPVLLSTAVGIVAIAIAEDAGGIVTGVLVISFTVTAAGCGLVAALLAGKKARLARRQADFVASMSHEFRTPLSAIRLYTQTLQSGKLADDPEQTARCLSTILRETEWLDVMIDRVLTWRASARDMMPLTMAVAPVSDAVNGAVERFRMMADPDEVVLACSVTTARPVCHDAQALNAVVLNLLTNAYKYTGDDKQIGIDARDEGDNVVIDVTDNGVGLSASEMKHVFEPFYRAKQEDGGLPGGIGLGLAIARHLVTRHGGMLTVRSEEGQGATFTVCLPVQQEAP